MSNRLRELGEHNEDYQHQIIQMKSDKKVQIAQEKDLFKQERARADKLEGLDKIKEKKIENLTRNYETVKAQKEELMNEMDQMRDQIISLRDKNRELENNLLFKDSSSNPAD